MVNNVYIWTEDITRSICSANDPDTLGAEVPCTVLRFQTFNGQKIAGLELTYSKTDGDDPIWVENHQSITNGTSPSGFSDDGAIYAAGWDSANVISTSKIVIAGKGSADSSVVIVSPT